MESECAVWRAGKNTGKAWAAKKTMKMLLGISIGSNVFIDANIRMNKYNQLYYS
jgi:hypothetical protein